MDQGIIGKSKTEMKKSEITKKIKEKALSLDFDLVGITSAKPHPHFSFFKNWIEEGKQASMKWLDRGLEKRGNPQKVLPGARSMICLGLNYYRGHPKSIDCQEKGKAWISNYAWGDDYHLIIEKKLKIFTKWLQDSFSESKSKAYVDTGPILERSYANSAGLGWIGKNTCLIHTKKGSYFFLAEIITDLVLDYDEEEKDHCGKCTRCIDACPTDALEAYKLDSNKCISYLTIEHRDEIDPQLKEKIGHHLYGCDICQDVCPWNRNPPLSSHLEFDPRLGNFHPSLSSLKKIQEEDFSERFSKSPIKRTKWKGLMRSLRTIIENDS